MIEKINLTEIEKNLIHQIASIQLESLKQIYYNGHPEISEFMQEYGEAYNLKEFDATLEVNDIMNTYCGIRLDPHLIFETNAVFLHAARFILLHDNWIPEHLYPNARKNLSNKLLRVISIKETINLN